MKNKKYILLFISFLWTGSPFVIAQSDDNESEDEIETLSPFEVTDKDVLGYSTTTTSSASRISVPITDVAGSIVTVNEKLIEDTVAVDIGDAFNFVSGVVAGNQGGGLQETNEISLRGYTSTGALRDGIPDFNYTNNGGFEYSLIQRVDIVKGPAGVQFGQHNQGGVINIVSKLPMPTPETKVDLMFGSFDFWRATVDHNNLIQQEKGDFGYRLSAAVTNTNGPVELASETGKSASYFINPSISYRFNNGLKLWFLGSFVDDKSSRVSNSVFMFGTPDGKGAAIKDFAGEASVVVQNFQFVESQTYEFGLTKGFNVGNVDADFRFVSRYGNREQSGNRTRANGGTVFIDNNGNQIPDGSPSVGRDPNMFPQIENNLSRFGRQGLRYNAGRPQDTDWLVLAGDMNLSFDIGPTRHKLLIYSQYQDVDTFSEGLDIRINNTATLPADIRSQFRFDTGIEGQGITEIWPNPPAGLGDLRDIILEFNDRFINRGTNDQKRELWNIAAIERMYLLDDRLILAAGIRFDSDDSFTQQVVNDNPLDPDVSTDKTTTTNYGLVYKFLKNENSQASLFFNNAETFVPVFQTDERLATLGQKFPNRTVETYEVGLKFNLFNNRLVATAAYFDTEEENILTGRRDEDGSITGVSDQNFLVPAGEQTTDGFELDVAITPSEEWNFLLSYSNIDSLVSEDDLPLWGVPETTFAALGTYSFPEGPLSGFSITGMYNRWGKSVLNRASNFVVPSGDKIGVVLGYEWKNWTARLRIDNLDDGTDLLPSTWWTGVGALVERNWRLSVGYRF